MSDFDQYAKNYESMQDHSTRVIGEGWDYFLKNKARFVGRQLTSNFSGRLLDFGCGIGGLSRELKAVMPQASIDGFDISDESIKRVPDELKRQGLFTSRLQDLKVPYDAVVVSGVFHHVDPSARLEVSGDLAGRLKTGGKAIIFEHNPLNPLTRYVVKQCEFDKGAILVFPKELNGYLEQKRVKIFSKTYMVFFPKFLSWLRPLENLLGWCPLGGTYALVGIKNEPK